MTRIAQARAALRNKFGARQYRITREGVIHVRGTMPNTNTELVRVRRHGLQPDPAQPRADPLSCNKEQR